MQGVSKKTEPVSHKTAMAEAFALSLAGSEREKLLRRLERYISRSDGCWLWGGAKDKKGYGLIGITVSPYCSILLRVPRLMKILTTGSLMKAGSFACHHCDIPACVRPDHIYEGDAVSNSLDVVRHGRDTSRRGFASMSPEKRREIAALGGKSLRPEQRSFSRNRGLAAAAGMVGGMSVPPEKRSFYVDRELARAAGAKRD